MKTTITIAMLILLSLTLVGCMTSTYYKPDPPPVEAPLLAEEEYIAVSSYQFYMENTEYKHPSEWFPLSNCDENMLAPNSPARIENANSAFNPAIVALLNKENQAKVFDHLDGVIFNAQFLDIPTYEGSGQIVHPQVIFFAEKFMGFHYIMVMTPYPFSNNAYENPSILGSQDGVIWEVPEGLINPVVGVPTDVMHGGYYSDPFILQNGNRLELWFRHTLAINDEGQRVQPRNSHNRIYRTVTWDLTDWTKLETILDCPNSINHFMSVAVMHNDSTYRLWYTNFNSQLFLINSTDLINWSERTQVKADLNGLGIWHHEIAFTGERYEALFTSANWENQPEFRLFFAVSDDGIDFGTGSEIDIEKISPELTGMTVHKCTFVNHDGVYQMYIAVFNHANVWRLFYFEVAEEMLYRLFG